MEEGLFRREAVAHSLGSQYGDPVLYQPVSLKLASFVLLLIFIGLVLIGASLKFKDTQLVRGHLEPSGGEVKVYSGRAGVVAQVLVKNGETVAKGQVLATMTPLGFGKAGVAVGESRLEKINEQIEQHGERMTLTSERRKTDESLLKSRIEGIRRELEVEADAQQVIQERIQIAETEFASAETLFSKGLASKVEYLQKKNAFLSVQQLYQQSRQRQISMENSLRGLEQELGALPLRYKEKEVELQSTLTQLMAQRIDVETQVSFTVISPVRGTVTNLDAVSGDYFAPQSPLLAILPEDATLEVNFYMPSRGLGAVERGQEVMLFYDAYPYQTYGFFAGVVTEISKSVTDPREFLLPVAIDEPFYRVKARLEQPTPESGVLLRSGMQLSAEIVTARKTLLDRLFEPLEAIGTRL